MDAFWWEQTDKKDWKEHSVHHWFLTDNLVIKNIEEIFHNHKFLYSILLFSENNTLLYDLEFNVPAMVETSKSELTLHHDN